MVLPILIGAIRGVALLGRGLAVGGRLAVRGIGQAAKWSARGLSSATRKGGKAISRVRLPKVKNFLPKAKKFVMKRSSRKPLPKSTQQKALKEFETFFNEHSKRTEAIRIYATRKITERVYEEIVARLAQEKDLAKGFEVVSGPKGVHAIRIVSRAKKMREREAVVLYVKARRRMQKTDPEIQVLEKYSPWTRTTLPFVPDPKKATVFKRVATRKEMKKVRLAREKDAGKWTMELRRLGIVAKKLQAKEVKAVADLAARSVQLEFGLGRKSIPHWRPAIAWVTRGGAEQVFGSELVQRAMFDPKYTGWKNWKPVSKKVSTRALREMSQFQQKLGIRG